MATKSRLMIYVMAGDMLIMLLRESLRMIVSEAFYITLVFLTSFDMYI